MAYQTGTASSQTDLMNKLQTFASSNGFTVDNYDGTNRFLSISRPADNLYMTFYWDGTNNIALYQALGYNASYAQQPWNQVDDSGNGNSTLANIYSGRNVNNIGAGPYTAYYFFAYANPYAIHIVLEFSPGLYRHFAFGALQKVGTWTGGAFVAGHQWNDQNSGSALDSPNSVVHTVLLDGRSSPVTSTYNYSLDSGATIHVEGLPDQPIGGKWGVCMRPYANEVRTDRGGTARVRISGGVREGVALSQYGWLLPDIANGFIPMVPFEVFYHEGDADSPPNSWYYLGRMANVTHIHLHGIDAAEEITVGSDTWVAFPVVRKSNIGGNNQESWNMGLFYRKVT